MSAIRFLLVTVLLVTIACTECAPFFDAIYDAINGNPRRSYGYSGYGNYDNSGYGGYNYYQRPRHPQPARTGKTWKDLCRVHYPAAAQVPGTGGIVCPY